MIQIDHIWLVSPEKAQKLGRAQNGVTVQSNFIVYRDPVNIP